MRERMSIVVAVVCVCAALLAAQTPSTRGSVTGTITDTAGTPLPGVTVSLSGSQRQSTVSNERGVFSFTNLTPGQYQLRAERPEHLSVEQMIAIAPGAAVTLSLRMAPSSKQEATATAETTRSGVGGGILTAPAAQVAGWTDARSLAAPPFNTEAYAHTQENGLRLVANDPLSTFSIDVDTASYANVRRFLSEGRLPPPGAVRVEELINYFRFDYPQPGAGDPFSITTELSECPWNPRHRLALIGLQGREMAATDTPPRNLVFLIDVSGSMQSPDKLPLVRSAMRMLVDVLRPEDRVAIVVYAGASGLVLPSTPGDRRGVIHDAIAQLEAGGSTNGAAGITLAYQVARQHFVRNGINRVVLATDGDFNVGVTSHDELVRLVEHERESGVFLSVLGVGTGNLKDSTMELLADKGNGNYSYLDSLHEARRVLVREAGATLATIARDVKIQIEFNPSTVAAYRLIGYENRVLRNEEFNDDRRDAGEMGAGHSVTALYEIVPAGVEVEGVSVDPLRYQRPPQQGPVSSSSELAMVKVRYKAPDGDESRLLTRVVQNTPRSMPENLGFASAVAEFGMLLRGSEHRGTASYESALVRARAHRGADPDGYRAEFTRLVDLASSLRSLGN